MRNAQTFLPIALVTALSSVIISFAAHAHEAGSNPNTSTEPRITDADSPSLALKHEALQASGSIVQQPGDWRAANAAVAEFPRGHADVLRWEAATARQQGMHPMPASKDLQHHKHMHGDKP